MAFFNIFSKEKKEVLDQGLDKTKQSFFSKISRAVGGKSTVDAEVLDNLEEILVMSDVVDTRDILIRSVNMVDRTRGSVILEAIVERPKKTPVSPKKTIVKKAVKSVSKKIVKKAVAKKKALKKRPVRTTPKPKYPPKKTK